MGPENGVVPGLKFSKSGSRLTKTVLRRRRRCRLRCSAVLVVGEKKFSELY